jgi:hypothetical protein
VRTHAPVTRFQTRSLRSLESEKASPSVSSWRWEESETTSDGEEVVWDRRGVAGERTEGDDEKDGRSEVKLDRYDDGLSSVSVHEPGPTKELAASAVGRLTRKRRDELYAARREEARELTLVSVESDHRPVSRPDQHSLLVRSMKHGRSPARLECLYGVLIRPVSLVEDGLPARR